MNYELIIKLAKLANNNPNDNEANSAARKVCKLIAEGNYNFGTTTKQPTQQTNPQRPPTMDYWEEFIRNMTNPNPASYWTGFDSENYSGRGKSDRQRQREEEKKERVYRESEEYQRRKRDEQLKEEMNRRARQQAKGYDYTQPKTSRKCSKCGQPKMTAFTGPDFLFTCMDCLWS